MRTLVRTGLALALLCIYLPHVGRGFVQDDFAWVPQVRGAVLNERVAGLEPFWYGLTNLLLMLACAAGVERLARQIGLAPWYSLLAAAVWAFNFHGIGMSVLWISGRTSLLSTLFAALAGYLVIRSQSGAFTPLTAPDYYHFTADPARLVKNLAEYVDRSGTIAAIVVLLLLLAARAPSRRRARSGGWAGSPSRCGCRSGPASTPCSPAWAWR